LPAVPAGIGVETQELADVGRADQPCLVGTGQDLGVAGDRADRPGSQRGPHLREVPVGDGLDARYPQSGLGEQRMDGPCGAGAARDHVLDDDGSGPTARFAVDQRTTGRACLGAYVGQRQVKPFGEGFRPRDPGQGHGDDVVSVGEG
jgi:hypothetical protein